MISFTPKLALVIRTVAERWNRLSVPWLIGGSCGLLAQGVALPSAPRDLDIYIDQLAVHAFHQAMLDYAIDEPASSVTDKYASTLSHYDIEGLPVELVAGFEVSVPQALYRVDIGGLSSHFGPSSSLDGVSIQYMPLSHELLFNLLRDRPDRYVPIAEKMRGNLGNHLPAMQAIVLGNRIGTEWIGNIAKLLKVNPESLRE